MLSASVSNTSGDVLVTLISFGVCRHKYLLAVNQAAQAKEISEESLSDNTLQVILFMSLILKLIGKYRVLSYDKRKRAEKTKKF